MLDKDTKWRVEISQTYVLDKQTVSNVLGSVAANTGKTKRATLIADLRFKAESAQAAAELGKIWIKASELTESCFVSSVACECPLTADFSIVDLPDVLAAEKQRVE